MTINFAPLCTPMYRISRIGQVPIIDVDTIEDIEPTIRDLKAGRYGVDHQVQPNLALRSAKGLRSRPLSPFAPRRDSVSVRLSPFAPRKCVPSILPKQRTSTVPVKTGQTTNSSGAGAGSSHLVTSPASRSPFPSAGSSGAFETFSGASVQRKSADQQEALSAARSFSARIFRQTKSDRLFRAIASSGEALLLDAEIRTHQRANKDA
jgi:hypothetical protein